MLTSQTKENNLLLVLFFFNLKVASSIFFWLLDDIITHQLFSKNFFATAKPIPGSLEKVKELYNNGDRVTFFTARTSAHAEVTEKWLNDSRTL